MNALVAGTGPARPRGRGAVAVAAVLAALVAGTAPAAEPIVNPALDETAFLRQLHDYKMNQLEEVYLQDHPLGEIDHLEPLRARVQLLKEIAEDSGAESPEVRERVRELARKGLIAGYRQLVRKFGGERQAVGWRADLAKLLVDWSAGAYGQRVIYQLIGPEELSAFARLLTEADELVVVAQRELDAAWEKMSGAEEKRPWIPVRDDLAYARPMIDFHRAQLAWYQAALRVAGPPPASQPASASVPEFFSPQRADRIANPQARSIFRLYRAWNDLFTGNSERAISQADELAKEPSFDPGKRVEAHILKATALRHLGRFEEAGKTLENATAFIAADRNLAAAPKWRVFVLLAQANLPVEQAIVAGIKQEQEAQNQRKAGNEGEAARLKEQAQAGYDQARDQAMKRIAEASAKDPQAATIYNLLPDLLLVWAGHGTGAPVDRVPPPEQLAKMTPMQLRRARDEAAQARNYDVAAAYAAAVIDRAFKESLLDPQTAAEQRAEALNIAGQIFYNRGMELKKTGGTEADESLAQAAKLFGRVRAEFRDYGEPTQIAENLVRSLLAQENALADPAKSAPLIAAMEQLKRLLPPGELDKYRLALAETYRQTRQVANYFKARDEYAAISSAHPDYRYAQGSIRDMIVLAYRTDPQAAEPGVIERDVTTLLSFDDAIGKAEAKKLLEQADKLHAATSQTRPDVVTDEEKRLRDQADKQRDLKGSYELEAARIWFRSLNNQAKAIELLDSVPKTYPSEAIQARAFSYKIDILMANQRPDEAAKVLLDLISVDPARASWYIVDVLSIIEEDHNRLRMQGKAAAAHDKAVQAEKLAATLVKEATNIKGVRPQDMVIFKIRWGRTLNWLDRHKEAQAVLAPLHDPAPHAVNEGNLVIELADASLDTGDVRKANDYYNDVSSNLHPSVLFKEIWWRAIVGQARCHLLLDTPNLKDIYLELPRWRAKGAAAGEDLPDYLLNDYMDIYAKVKRRLIERGELAPTDALERQLRDDAAKARQKSTDHTVWKHAGLLLGIGVGAIAILAVVQLVINARKKSKAAARARR